MPTPNKDLDALVEKWSNTYHNHDLHPITMKEAMKQCALEWAEKVQSELDNKKYWLSEYERVGCKILSILGTNHTSIEDALNELVQDRDQWKARALSAEALISEHNKLAQLSSQLKGKQ